MIAQPVFIQLTGYSSKIPKMPKAAVGVVASDEQVDRLCEIMRSQAIRALLRKGKIDYTRASTQADHARILLQHPHLLSRNVAQALGIGHSEAETGATSHSSAKSVNTGQIDAYGANAAGPSGAAKTPPAAFASSAAVHTPAGHTNITPASVSPAPVFVATVAMVAYRSSATGGHAAPAPSADVNERRNSTDGDSAPACDHACLTDIASLREQLQALADQLTLVEEQLPDLSQR